MNTDLQRVWTMADERYWLNREIRHAKMMLKNENEIVKEMQNRYRIAAREVEKEINTLLDNYAGRNGLSLADVKGEVSATDIRDYEDKARKYVKERSEERRVGRECR